MVGRVQDEEPEAGLAPTNSPMIAPVASDNEELIELLGQVRDKVRWMFEVDLPGRSQDSWSDHALILEAILAGAAETAAQGMDVHVAKDELLYRDKFRMGDA